MTDTTRTPEQCRLALKKKVRFFYDIQRLRIQCAGRTLPKGEENPLQLHEIDQAILDQRSKELLVAEKTALKDVEQELKTVKMYTEILTEKPRFRGLGPTLSGVILAEFDIQRQDTPSKMWSFAGLRPVEALRCKECFRVVKKGEKHPSKTKKNEKIKCAFVGEVLTASQIVESSQSMRPTKGEKLPYNAWLRSKLVGVLGPCLLKANSPWREYYDNYKHRKESAGWGVGDGHRHNAAIRYMVKMLLLEIWREWRVMENLPVRPSYQEEYLGHVHQKAS